MSAEQWQRLPASSILAQYLQGVAASVGVVLVFLFTLNRPDFWAAPVAIPLLIAGLVLRFVGPVLTWRTTRYRDEGEHLHLRTGWFSTRVLTIAWEDVRSIDIEQPWSMRPWKLCVAKIGTTGDPDGSRALTGIDLETASRWAGRVTQHADDEETADGVDEPAVVSTEDAVVPGAVVPGAADAAETSEQADAAVAYRATTRDLVLASLVYGQFLVAGIAMATAAINAFSDFDTVAAFVMTLPPGIVITGVFALLAIGLSSSVLRFRGFTVAHTPKRITISYGLLTVSRREIRRSAIVGIRVQRNIVEQVLDRARVSLLTSDASGENEANVVMLSLPRRTVRDVLTEVVPGVPVGLLDRSGRRSIVLTLLALVVIAVPIASGVLALVFTDWPRWVVVIGAIVVAGVAASIVGTANARIAFDGEIVSARRIRLVESEDAVTVRAVHFVRRSKWGPAPSLVTAEYYAGSSQSARGVTRDESLMPRIGTAVLERSPQVRAERRTVRARARRRARARAESDARAAAEATQSAPKSNEADSDASSTASARSSRAGS